MERKFPANNFFRLNYYIAFISHVSKKGQAVGYIFYDGKWWGPVAWGKHGRSELNRSDFDVLDGKFQAGNCLNRGPVFKKEEALPVKELLKALKSKSIP